MDMIDFKHLTLPQKPNYYLVCPRNYCNVPAQAIAPTYALSLEQLQQHWQQMLAKQPRTHMTQQLKTQHHYQYVQYSLIFHFPDYIDVQFIPITPHQTTLAIFSRAKYGYSDFKVNEKRIKQWLQQIHQVITPD